MIIQQSAFTRGDDDYDDDGELKFAHRSSEVRAKVEISGTGQRGERNATRAKIFLSSDDNEGERRSTMGQRRIAAYLYLRE